MMSLFLLWPNEDAANIHFTAQKTHLVDKASIFTAGRVNADSLDSPHPPVTTVLYSSFIFPKREGNDDLPQISDNQTGETIFSPDFRAQDEVDGFTVNPATCVELQ